MGAASSQCHENSTCVCRPGFVGYKCDRCQDNFFLADGDTGCQECPTCYALVKEEVSCQAQTRPPSDQFHISIEHQPMLWPRGCLATHRSQACVPTGHPLLSSPSLLIPIHLALIWSSCHIPSYPPRDKVILVQLSGDGMTGQTRSQRTTLEGLISNSRIARSSL